MPGWRENATFALAERFLNELRYGVIHPERLTELEKGPANDVFEGFEIHTQLAIKNPTCTKGISSDGTNWTY